MRKKQLKYYQHLYLKDAMSTRSLGALQDISQLTIYNMFLDVTCQDLDEEVQYLNNLVP